MFLAFFSLQTSNYGYTYISFINVNKLKERIRRSMADFSSNSLYIFQYNCRFLFSIWFWFKALFLAGSLASRQLILALRKAGSRVTCLQARSANEPQCQAAVYFTCRDTPRDFILSVPLLYYLIHCCLFYKYLYRIQIQTITLYKQMLGKGFS
jgi:hypothetical protein